MSVLREKGKAERQRALSNQSGPLCGAVVTWARSSINILPLSLLQRDMKTGNLGKIMVMS